MLTRLQILCMTPKTRLDYDGVNVDRQDFSIHHNKGPEKFRGIRADGGNITEPRRERQKSTYRKKKG